MIKCILCKLKKGDNLFILFDEFDQYWEGFVVFEINVVIDILSFINGVELIVGDVIGDVNEVVLCCIQIWEIIKVYFDKEEVLFQ